LSVCFFQALDAIKLSARLDEGQKKPLLKTVAQTALLVLVLRSGASKHDHGRFGYALNHGTFRCPDFRARLVLLPVLELESQIIDQTRSKVTALVDARWCRFYSHGGRCRHICWRPGD
jgi:hypothetical protein